MWVIDKTTNEKYSNISTHQTFSLLAAINDTHIHIYDSTGQQLQILSAPNSKAAYISKWCPKAKILATGWSDGMITFWFTNENITREGNIHMSTVKTMQWNSSGSRLITADDDGQVIVWQVDFRGRIISLAQYRISKKIKFCKFLLEEDSKMFYLICENGHVYFADDCGHCDELISLPDNPHQVFIPLNQNMFVSLSKNLILSRAPILPNGKLGQMSDMKIASLSKHPEKIQVCLIKNSIMIVSIRDQPLITIDIVSDESQSEIFPMIIKDSEYVTDLNWNDILQLLLVSMSSGDVLIWKRTNVGNWKLNQIIKSEYTENISAIWCPNNDIIIKGMNSFKRFAIHDRLFSSVCGYMAIQNSKSSFVFESSKSKNIVETNCRIKKIKLSQESAAVWDGQNIHIYAYSNDLEDMTSCGKISSENANFDIDKSAVYVASSNSLIIYNHGGVKKHSISVHSEDIMQMHVNSGVLALLAGKDLKLYDILRREPRLLVSKTLSNIVISSIKVNSNGKMILINGYDCSSNISDCIIYVYSVSNGAILTKSLPMDACSVSYFWDSSDPRVLTCHGDDNLDSDGKSSKIIVNLYVSDSEIGEIDRYIKPDQYGDLVDVSLPYHRYVNEASLNLSSDDLTLNHKLKQYQNIDDGDVSAIKAITDFGISISKGNVDDAVKAVKFIKKSNIWESLAALSIQAKRVDVAILCLSKIGNAKALRALKDLNDAKNDEKAAIIAIYLGLYDTAKSIYQENNRMDLQNNFYQMAGAWEPSLGVKHGINTKKDYHKFAKYLAEIDDITGSIAAFEKSGNHCTEVPQLLCKVGKLKDLKKYIDLREEKVLKRWWAKYCESQGNVSEAISYYKMAEDYLSLTRLYCFIGQVDEAVHLIDKTNNLAVAYHLARYYEEQGKTMEAVVYYSKAKSFGNAIRICKENNMINELMGLALQGSKECMLDVARYFEEFPEHLEKAGHLYCKSGSIGKAIKIYFKTKNFAALLEMVLNFKSELNPTLVSKCIQFFVDNSVYDKACLLCIISDKIQEAIQLCKKYNLTITEEMAESLTSKSSETDKNLIFQIAELLEIQQSYMLASKKYMQIGERLKAMQALLKSGDKDKIIYFANISGQRQPEIFIMAANFLQSLEWRNDTAVMKAIITFYSKAKAFPSLASFYESCAMVEIEEYQNYEKGHDAISEALKCLQKTDFPGKHNRISALEIKLNYLQMFLEATKREHQDENAAISICTDLIDQDNIDETVKIGDIYALILKVYRNQQNFDLATIAFEKMKQQVDNNDIPSYLDDSMLQWIGYNASTNGHYRSETGASGISEYIEESL